MKCSVEQCANERAEYSKYCAAHVVQIRKYGKVVFEEIRKNNNRTKHYLYSTWISMRDRCNNPRNRHYKNYGGRGVKVCDRWMDHAHGFENFLSDMGDRPKGCSLDRIDNNGNYSPENCKWSNKVEQNLNKRTSRSVPYISTRVRHGREEYIVRIKDLRDKTSCTVKTKVRKTLEDAIIARDELLKEMKKEGAR